MLFSIVTVVLNDKKGIEKTIKSIINQTFKDYEYIILDGKSSDGTAEYMEAYAERFIEKGIDIQFSSESDSGIYNAMNKGITKARGEYTIFMNAGDSFVDSYVLEKIAADCNGDFDAVYGDYIFVLNKWERVIPAKSVEELLNNMPFCHQSIFVKTDILRKYCFNEKYKICADYDMFLRMYKNKCSFKQVSLIVSRYNSDGLSMSDYGRKPEIEKQVIKSENGIISNSQKFKNDSLIYIKYYYTRLKYAVKVFIPQKMLYSYREKKFTKQGWSKVEN